MTWRQLVPILAGLASCRSATLGNWGMCRLQEERKRDRMGSHFKSRRALATLMVTAVLSACAVAPDLANPVAMPPQPAEGRLGVTQVGENPTRYVYCDLAICPTPTEKTRAIPKIAAAMTPQLTTKLPVGLPAKKPPTTIDVAFKFNSAVLSASDLGRLKAEAIASAGADVRLISRSDFVGPPAGQTKLAKARAAAMHHVVAKQAPETRISETQEIAGPQPVDAEKQAHQRRGSVIFQPSSFNKESL